MPAVPRIIHHAINLRIQWFGSYNGLGVTMVWELHDITSIHAVLQVFTRTSNPGFCPPQFLSPFSGVRRPSMTSRIV